MPDKGAGQSTWCAEWGGFLKDVKRRDTANYMFVTAGPKMLRLWALDPVWPRVFVRPGAAPPAALVLLLVCGGCRRGEPRRELGSAKQAPAPCLGRLAHRHGERLCPAAAHSRPRRLRQNSGGGALSSRGHLRKGKGGGALSDENSRGGGH